MIKRIGFLFIGILCGMAQSNKIMRAEVEQKVENGYLLLDFYVQRLISTPFSLGAANFSVYLTDSALNISGAVLDNTYASPWSSAVNPQDYYPLDLKKKENFIVVNVVTITASPGSGTVVPTTRTRLARVKVPITKPWGFNTLTWRIAPCAITNWQMEDFISQVEFVTPPPDFPLCQTPMKPSLIELSSGHAVSSLTFCQGNAKEILIQSDSSVLTYDVYLDGKPLHEDITDSIFVVSASGTYTVVAEQYSCRSDESSPLTIQVISPPDMPLIQFDQTTGELVCQVTLDSGDSLQWYYEGQPIPNAHGLTYQPTQNGEYYVVVWNQCGQQESNHYQYIVTQTDYSIPVEWNIEVRPNPFVNTTPVLYLDLPQKTQVSATLYDLLGKEVARVFDGTLQPGHHEFPIHSDFAQATYILKVKCNENTKIFKLQHLNQ